MVPVVEIDFAENCAVLKCIDKVFGDGCLHISCSRHAALPLNICIQLFMGEDGLKEKVRQRKFEKECIIYAQL